MHDAWKKVLSWFTRLIAALRQWKPYRPFSEATGEISGAGINLLVLGFSVRKMVETRQAELWLGPYGLLLKLQLEFHGRLFKKFHFRLASDTGRSYLASFLIEITFSSSGYHHNLEFLIGPFGYLANLCARLHLGQGERRMDHRLLIFPGGILASHKWNFEWGSGLKLHTHLEFGPYRSVAGLQLDAQRSPGEKSDGRLGLTIGPLATLAQTTMSFRKKKAQGVQIFSLVKFGPGGTLARLGLGLDASSKPLRPYVEISTGISGKYGFLYHHSPSETTIANMVSAGSENRSARLIVPDALVPAGRDMELSVCVVEGMPGFLSPPIAGARVRFQIDGNAIGSARTGDTGWTQKPISGLAAGEHVLSARLTSFPHQKKGTHRAFSRGEANQEWFHAKIFSIAEGTPIIALRLDEMLATGLTDSIIKQDRLQLQFQEETLEVLGRLAETFAFIYLTDLPAQFMSLIHGFCFDEKENQRGSILPRGMLLHQPERPSASRGKRLPFPDTGAGNQEQTGLERALATKLYRGIPILAGVSHLPVDLGAFANVGIRPLPVSKPAGEPVNNVELLAHLNALEEQAADMAMQALALNRKRETLITTTSGEASWKIRCLTGVNASSGNHLHLFDDAGSAVNDIFRSINNADKAVHLSTMILGNDRIGTRLTDQMVAAAGRGTPVRMIVDQWLSDHSDTFSNPNVKRLSKSPVDLRIRRLADGFARCHKKTITTLRTGNDDSVVMDSFVGGMNWCDPSFGNFPENLEDNPIENPERDLFARVWGPAGEELQNDFLDVWQWTTGEELSLEERKRLIAPTGLPAPGSYYTRDEAYQNIPIQVVGSIPGRDGRVLRTFLALIASAKERICIQQNFPPGRLVLEELIGAMKRGVQVDWIFGARKGPSAVLSDNLNLNKAAILMKAGTRGTGKNLMRVRRYPITVHMKAMVIDEDVLYFGTANLDTLSLEMDAETMLVVPHPPAAKSFLENWFEKDFEASRPVSYNPASDTLRVDGKEETAFGRLDRLLLDAIMPDEVK